MGAGPPAGAYDITCAALLIALLRKCTEPSQKTKFAPWVWPLPKDKILLSNARRSVKKSPVGGDGRRVLRGKHPKPIGSLSILVHCLVPSKVSARLIGRFAGEPKMELYCGQLGSKLEHSPYKIVLDVPSVMETIWTEIHSGKRPIGLEVPGLSPEISLSPERLGR
jgi:hypothetical protein